MAIIGIWCDVWRWDSSCDLAVDYMNKWGHHVIDHILSQPFLSARWARKTAWLCWSKKSVFWIIPSFQEMFCVRTRLSCLFGWRAPWCMYLTVAVTVSIMLLCNVVKLDLMLNAFIFIWISFKNRMQEISQIHLPIHLSYSVKAHLLTTVDDEAADCNILLFSVRIHVEFCKLVMNERWMNITSYDHVQYLRLRDTGKDCHDVQVVDKRRLETTLVHQIFRRLCKNRFLNSNYTFHQRQILITF